MMIHASSFCELLLEQVATFRLYVNIPTLYANILPT